MVKDFSRTDRIADAIQRVLAVAIAQEIRDPRVGMVNINDVTVSRDMAYAKVYVTFIDRESEDDCLAATHALNHAAGFLRGLLAAELDIRVTPRLQFIYDTTVVRGQNLSSLINKAIAEDQLDGHSGDDNHQINRD